ncbi:HTH domain-containing protein [Streptomyces reniochalinae]|uniref:HTH domain-containing protein n=1 Tax=Streptomyces reniochalinae TaxID=2250578 RepID=A0A367E8T4_9ACTN|nr:HTH domain-containing protein [Streptomyces reniochalinae]RCG14075.1 HTH domain-containing protein [Streptomyces reniochalinae]
MVPSSSKVPDCRMTAPELAGELDVSVRTVYRDIDALSASGVPVYADRGPAGGYRLMDGYRTRPTGLTDSEAGSLFLSGLPGAAEELGLGAVLTTAQLKVQAALPTALAEHTRRVQNRFHLDAPGWFRNADPVPHLEAGWIETDLDVESQPVAVCDLLGLGAEAEVLGPPALRAAMTEAVTALSARYAI